MADERTNAILDKPIVPTAPQSRITEVIDFEEMLAAIQAMKPLTVVLKNSKAARIEQLLRTVFKSQLTTRNVRRELGERRSLGLDFHGVGRR